MDMCSPRPTLPQNPSISNTCPRAELLRYKNKILASSNNTVSPTPSQQETQWNERPNVPPPITTNTMIPSAHRLTGLRFARSSCREGFVGFFPDLASFANLAFRCLISNSVGWKFKHVVNPASSDSDEQNTNHFGYEQEGERV